ncbi:hypothetical protein J3R82DRAFT_8905 [Butyriboletus roseoflavus]|nr:hypothetical protein J3R82DRAFT_8905 [Butyriboletus roseoflavus]
MPVELPSKLSLWGRPLHRTKPHSRCPTRSVVHTDSQGERRLTTQVASSALVPSVAKSVVSAGLSTSLPKQRRSTSPRAKNTSGPSLFLPFDPPPPFYLYQRLPRRTRPRHPQRIHRHVRAQLLCSLLRHVMVVRPGLVRFFFLPRRRDLTFTFHVHRCLLPSPRLSERKKAGPPSSVCVCNRFPTTRAPRTIGAFVLLLLLPSLPVLERSRRKTETRGLTAPLRSRWTGGRENKLQARLRATPRRFKAGLQAFRTGLDRKLAPETRKVCTMNEEREPFGLGCGAPSFYLCSWPGQCRNTLSFFMLIDCDLHYCHVDWSDGTANYFER